MGFHECQSIPSNKWQIKLDTTVSHNYAEFLVMPARQLTEQRVKCKAYHGARKPPQNKKMHAVMALV